MAIIRKFYSDSGRTFVLTKAAETAKSDKTENDNYLSDELVVEIDAFIPSWISAINALNSLLSIREKEVREKNEALSMLDIVLRDVWEVLKRRVRRQKLPAEVLTYYELPLSGIIPKYLNQMNMLSLASKIIAGEKKAVLAGYKPMENPNIGELILAMDIAKKEIGDVAPADRDYDKAEEVVEGLRVKADELIADIVDELKFNLRKKDAASQRRIIRSYGVQIDNNHKKDPETGNEDEDNEEEPIDMDLV